MFEILFAYGIPRRIVDTVKLMYEDTKAKVVSSDDGETEFFDIAGNKAGVLQVVTKTTNVTHTR